MIVFTIIGIVVSLLVLLFVMFGLYYTHIDPILTKSLSEYTMTPKSWIRQYILYKIEKSDIKDSILKKSEKISKMIKIKKNETLKPSIKEKFYKLYRK